MTRYQRITRKYKAEYQAGAWKGGRIHIYTSGIGIVRECRAAIAKHHQGDRKMRDARKAFYLGALATIKHERELCAHFRL